MQHITIYDYLLLPLYLIFFYWRTKKVGKQLQDSFLRKCLFGAFAFRMLGAIGYSLLTEYYYGIGDSFTFYDGGTFYRQQILASADNIRYLFASFADTSELYNNVGSGALAGYFDTPSNNMVMRISAIFSFFTFNKFLLIALCFGFFSFLGQWRLFLVFDDINMRKHRKLLFLTVLCAPSIWFWGSGLLKDSICLGATGFIVSILYNFYKSKKISVTGIVSLLFLFFLVYTIKTYIAAILLASIGIMLIALFFQSIKHLVLRAFLLVMTIIVLTIIVFESSLPDNLETVTGTAITQIKDFQHTYETVQEGDENSKAGFALGEFDPSLQSLILKSPLVVFTTLFRPFIWESKKLIIFLSALESTFLLLFTFYLMIKLRVIGFFRAIFGSPYLLFCFVMSMLFCFIIGFTTFNFGTMIRYKVIFVPFYYFLLVYMYTHYLKPK